MMNASRNLACFVAAVSLDVLLMSCASGGETSVGGVAVSSEEATEAAMAIAPVGTDGLATYDESIPDGAFRAYEFLHDDLQSISDASEVVFIGRVTDYVEAVVVVPPDPEDPWGSPSVYDGVVFTVDELLAGEPADASRITVATFALIRNNDGSPRVRISASPIEIVRAGIEQRNLPDGPRYLVYARHHTPQTSVLYRPDLYFFNTSGRVVEILADDSLGVGANPPLARVAVETDGVHSTVDHGLSLSDARAAVAVSSEDFDPAGDGPVDDARDEDPISGGDSGGLSGESSSDATLPGEDPPDDQSEPDGLSPESSARRE